MSVRLDSKSKNLSNRPVKEFVKSSHALDFGSEIWDDTEMQYQELVTHFGGLSAAGRALGIDRRRVFAWKGARIPSHWQSKIEVVTEGALRADDRTRQDAQMYSGLAA